MGKINRSYRINAFFRCITLLLCVSISANAFSQSNNCSPGDDSAPLGNCPGGALNAAGQWECPPPENPCQCGTGNCICIPVVGAIDPNDIQGPLGYGPEQWVAAKDRLTYRIRFENSQAFATAPAQVVRIELPISEELDPFSLQLHDFGFGSFAYQLTNAPAFHSDRIEETSDSLGVFVDVTGGLDIVNRKLFWTFRSIDPATGLQPNDPLIGFLPINDTTLADTVVRPGEGYLTFSLRPTALVETGDSALAQGSIIFDLEAPILTNTWFNLIDAIAPESTIEPLPVFTEVMALSIHWDSDDDPGGVGIHAVDLFASKNGGPFYTVATDLQSGFFVFEGDTGANYSFYTIAEDLVGNREALRPGTPAVQFGGITSARIQVKAYLQGAWNGAEMSTAISSIAPLTDPYGLNESVTAIPPDVVDWVRLQVRSALDSTQIIAQRACFLRKDGVVLDKDGQPGVIFTGLTMSHGYLVIRHRNHFGVMTGQALLLTQPDLSIDLTAATTSTYGTNPQASSGNIRLLRMGNVNGDDVLKYTGPNNDRDPILLAIGGVVATNVVSGYRSEDVNLDGLVKYTGADNDRDPILFGIGGIIPTNVVLEQLP